MSETTCAHCGATSHNGLVLCELCRYKANDILVSLPVHFRNLARWKPGRAGSRPVPGSRVLFDGDVRPESPDRISRAVDEVGNEITTWARALADDRGIEVPDGETEVDAIVAACVWLAQHLTSIGTLEWAGEFVSGITRSERRLSVLTMTVVPGWYAGTCRRKVAMATEDHDGLCGAELFVVPGLSVVTCGFCSTSTFARDHVDDILNEARGWISTPKRVAEAIVALVDTEASIEDLRKRIAIWGDRNHIATHRPNNYAAKRYQLGEVLEVIQSKSTTRQIADWEAS